MKFPKPLTALSSVFLLAVLIAGCSTPPWGGTGKPGGVPLVILDTDIGSSAGNSPQLPQRKRHNCHNNGLDGRVKNC